MTNTPWEFFEILIQDFPPSEYWYLVMGLPPLATAPFSEIERTPLEVGETRIEGALGGDGFEVVVVVVVEVAAPNPKTSTGVALDVVVPFPNSSLLLFPQHFAPPLVMTAQVWIAWAPAEIAATPEVRPVTSTGVELFVNVPFPSSP